MISDPLGHKDESYRTCSECGKDCPPEAVPTVEGMRIAFNCPDHCTHTVIDPFKDLS